MNFYRDARTVRRWAVLALAAGLAAFGPAGAEIIDEILATVGDEVILRSDIMIELAPFLTDLQRTASSQEEYERQAQQQLQETVKQAVENKILLRQARLEGLEVTDAQIEERIREMRRQFDSAEAFTKYVTEAGGTMTDFQNHVRKQLLAVSMGLRKRRQFEQDAVVSEADVMAYYNEHRGEFERPEQVRVRRIFLKAPNEGERAAARERLEALRKEIALGADFGELAKAHSEGPAADHYGVIGWVRRGDLVEELERVAFALEPGQISDVLETPYGVLILMVDERQTPRVVPLEEARGLIEPELRAQIADERYREWMAELHKRSRVRMFR